MKQLFALILILLPGAALAFDPVETRVEFLRLVQGKELRIALFGVALRVSPDGAITGRGGGRDVTGDWRWQDGAFCRSMTWGDEALPYNCQLIEVNGNRMRITSDRGTGQSAVFTLR